MLPAQRLAMTSAGRDMRAARRGVWSIALLAVHGLRPPMHDEKGACRIRASSSGDVALPWYIVSAVSLTRELPAPRIGAASPLSRVV
jgi:hypothetical protein